MSYILSTKYSRQSDSDFIIAAARAFYVDWWCNRMEELGQTDGWSGCELTEIAPETQRWAFKTAREFHHDIIKHVDASYLDHWREQWSGDREGTDDMIGWYAAMEAMGHGVGLWEYGIDVDLPHVEAYP